MRTHVWLTVCLVATLAACGKKKEEAKDTTAPTVPAAPAPAASIDAAATPEGLPRVTITDSGPADCSKLGVPSLAGVKLGDTRPEVEQRLGKPAASPCQKIPGEGVTIRVCALAWDTGVSVSMVDEGGTLYADSISVTRPGAALATDGGLGVGAPAESLLKAFGPCLVDTETGKKVAYDAAEHPAELIFSTGDKDHHDAVTEITLTSASTGL